jgi:hypothetical protein
MTAYTKVAFKQFKEKDVNKLDAHQSATHPIHNSPWSITILDEES